MEEYKLNDLLRLSEEEMREYKLHLAKFNGETQPLDVFARDFEEWKYWNEWRGKGTKDVFNRKYILGLIHDYHRSNKYIFGGIFEVKNRLEDYNETNVGYEIELSDKLKPLIGRLVIHFESYQGMRGRAFLLENYIDSCSVSEIAEKCYEGIDFPGYDNVLLDFSTLEVLAHNEKTDWKVALENMKGVYLIADKNNGKKYVGSAYGEYGIWYRWCTYAGTAHGGNDQLVDLIEKEGFDYARKFFQLSLLEIWPMRTDDETIINRESHWKNVLLTRGDFGYNKN